MMLDLGAMDSMLGVADPGAEVARSRLRSLGAAGQARPARGVFSDAALVSSRPQSRPPTSRRKSRASTAWPKFLRTVPQRAATPAAPNDYRELHRRAREVMLGCGLTEAGTIAFIAPADNSRFPGSARRGGAK